MTPPVRCFHTQQQASASHRRLSSPRYNLEHPELRRREEKTLTQSSSARQPRPTRCGLTNSDSLFPNPHFRSSTTTESSGVYIAHGRELPVDEHGRIEPYVDFGPFYKLWSQRTEGIDNQQHSQRLE